MSEYQVEFSATAEKQFRKLQKPVQLRLAQVIKLLAAEPRPRGCVEFLIRPVLNDSRGQKPAVSYEHA